MVLYSLFRLQGIRFFYLLNEVFIFSENRTSFVLDGATFWVAEASPAVVKVEALPPVVDGAMGFSAQPSVLMATLVFLLCAVLIR